MEEPSTLPLGGNPQTVRGHKWIRGILDGHTIVSSRDFLFVWEVPYWPWWFFRTNDIDAELIESQDPASQNGLPDGAVAFDLVGRERTLPAVARSYPDHEILRGWFTLDFDALDHWFEEDIEVFVHPRSPYTRIDALASSRHVVVSLNGIELANSQKPTVLFETGAPARFYLPMTDVSLHLLAENDRRSACPYKGESTFFDTNVGGSPTTDVAWTYILPRPESTPIAGLISFFNEIVDIDVDGERQPRPISHFT